MGDTQSELRITIPPAREMTYASGVEVRKPPGEMVFLDFFQLDPAFIPPEHGTVVSRLVLTAAAARNLRAQLADVLPDADA